VLVEPGKSTEMSVMLTLLAGSFDITTDPAGALEIFDTVNLGTNTVLLPAITVGNHTLMLRKEGYRFHDQDVTVFSDRTTIITLTLMPASPQIEVYDT
jgi:hypothetical protein